MLKQREIHKIKDYLDYIEGLENVIGEFYYRGQSAEYVKMPPSVARERNFLNHEGDIFCDACVLAPEKLGDLKTPLEKLAKQQHYNIPTRLVDVTTDPLVALYFATEDVGSKYGANIYVYDLKGVEPTDERVQALSLIASQREYDLNQLCQEYEKIFGASITKEKFLDLIKDPVLVKMNEDLKNSNRRLSIQKGAFIVCGNKVLNGSIQRELISLDTLNPKSIIHIPYEYKELIHNELDYKYGINKMKIYPELPSVGDYLRKKYGTRNKPNINDCYIIQNDEDNSTPYIKRGSIFVTLTKNLGIDEIKGIASLIIKQYADSNDVVWVYIAKNEADYVQYNWILRAQWINPSADERFIPLPLEKKGDDGYSWSYSTNYYTMGQFYEDYYVGDHTLLNEQYKIFAECKNVYGELKSASRESDLPKLIELIHNSSSKFEELDRKGSNIGLTKNKKFRDYLMNYRYFTGSLDNLKFWADLPNLNDRGRLYHLNKVINRATEYAEVIERDYSYWKKEVITSGDQEGKE